jgi:hypothetical protein
MATRLLRLKRYRHSRILLLIFVVACLAFTFFAYQVYEGRVDKRGFQEARRAIDTVYADVVKKVGVPDEYKHTNECSRPSGVYEDGPLSCSVGTSLIYGVSNRSEANRLFRQVQGVIGSHPDLFKPTQPLATSIEDTLIVNTYYHSALDKYTVSGLTCVAKHIYDTEREINLRVQTPTKKPFQVNISCTDFAETEHFPAP